MDPDKLTWTCPDGYIACSTNTTLGGSTVCATDRSECPVTDLVLLDKDSDSFKLDSSSGYTTSLSSGGLFSTKKQLYLAFTTQTNERSNAPLNHIFWDAGYKC